MIDHYSHGVVFTHKIFTRKGRLISHVQRLLLFFLILLETQKKKKTKKDNVGVAHTPPLPGLPTKHYFALREKNVNFKGI